MAAHEWQPISTDGVSTCATCPAVRWDSGPVLMPVERCRCTTVEHGEPLPAEWRDVDRDGIVEWCIACDDGIALTYEALDLAQVPA